MAASRDGRFTRGLLLCCMFISRLCLPLHFLFCTGACVSVFFCTSYPFSAKDIPNLYHDLSPEAENILKRIQMELVLCI